MPQSSGPIGGFGRVAHPPSIPGDVQAVVLDSKPQRTSHSAKLSFPPETAQGCAARVAIRYLPRCARSARRTRSDNGRTQRHYMVPQMDSCRAPHVDTHNTIPGTTATIFTSYPGFTAVFVSNDRGTGPGTLRSTAALPTTKDRMLRLNSMIESRYTTRILHHLNKSGPPKVPEPLHHLS